MLNLGRYRKFIVALVGAAVLGLGLLLGEESNEFEIIVSLLTALGVYATPN